MKYQIMTGKSTAGDASRMENDVLPIEPRHQAVPPHLPPAIAGTMLISSPSLTGVSRFLRKRMSSSFR